MFTEYIVKEPLINVVSFLFRIFSHQDSKQPHNSVFCLGKSHNSLSSCYCSLFVWISVRRKTDASFSQSKFHAQIQNPHGLLNRLMISYIRFIKDDSFSEFAPKYHTMCSWSLDFSNWKNISTVLLTIIYSPYNMVCTCSKDIHCGTVGEKISWDILFIIFR